MCCFASDTSSSWSRVVGGGSHTASLAAFSAAVSAGAPSPAASSGCPSNRGREPPAAADEEEAPAAAAAAIDDAADAADADADAAEDCRFRSMPSTRVRKKSNGPPLMSAWKPRLAHSLARADLLLCLRKRSAGVVPSGSSGSPSEASRSVRRAMASARYLTPTQ